MSYERYVEFMQRVEEYRGEHPQQRRGQAYFNVLCEFDLEAAQQIRNTPMDPLYADWDTLSEFRAWLRARWGAL